MAYQGSDKPSVNKNIYSWNNKANILFLDGSPGAGFSINEDKNFKYNDNRIASYSMTAIQEWFKLFP